MNGFRKGHEPIQEFKREIAVNYRVTILFILSILQTIFLAIIALK